MALFSLAGVVIPYLFLSGLANLLALEEAKEARRRANIREAMAANPPAREAVGLNLDLLSSALDRK